MGDFTESDILLMLTQAWRHGFQCAAQAKGDVWNDNPWYFEDACNDDLVAIISGQAEELGPIGELARERNIRPHHPDR
ncbi:hypothetical protein JCM19000A_43060 [Silvimonas sp. JCM 19000]